MHQLSYRGRMRGRGEDARTCRLLMTPGSVLSVESSSVLLWHCTYALLRHITRSGAGAL